MVWLSWSPPEGRSASLHSAREYTALFGSMGVLLLGVGLYSRVMTRRLSGPSFYRDMHYFNRLIRICRLAIPIWFAVAVFAMDWPAVVRRMVVPSLPMTLDAPLLLVGTLPAVLAMILLWWAAYPAERALREIGILDQLDKGLPVRMGPSLWQHLASNIRLQLLFMFVPVLAILALRDVLAVTLHMAGIPISQSLEIIVALLCMLPVVVISPVLLAWVLPTEPLPDSPLRQRLEALCRQHGIRVKNVLLWRTHSSIGNAAVMGVIPGLRYLLVTDLLLEAMPEEQVVAVFAHEIGHIAHRHLLWMAGCALCLLFAAAGPAETLLRWVDQYVTLEHPYDALLTLVIAGPALLGLFGYVVRRFERQADVFAARSLRPAALQSDLVDQDFVTSHGARVVCAALQHIAALNNVPVKAGEWLHGSIAWRMNFLIHISDDPHRTLKFDIAMRRLGRWIIVVLIAMAVWTVWNMLYLDAAAVP